MKRLFYLFILIPFCSQAQIIRLSGIADPAPISITITGSFGPFANVAGTASNPQSVGIAGTGLINPISIPCQTGFEISKDSSTWVTTSVSYALTNGVVSNAKFYARVAASTAVGSYNGNFVASSSPAASVNIPYSATVSAAASLSGSPSSISNLNATAGTAGTAQTVTATFAGLSGAVTATAIAPVEVSQDGGSTYAQTQSFSTGSPKALKIRIAASATAGAVSNNFKLSASGVSDVLIPVTGTVSAAGSSSDTARFAMSLTSQTVPTGFVSFFGDPSTGVRTATNQAGNITISTVSTANWSAVSGGCANDADGLAGSTVAGFPDNILRAQMYTYSGSSNTADSANQGLSKPNFSITGLNSSATYHIEMTADLDGGRFNLTCTNKFRAMGSTTTALIATDPNGGAQTVNFNSNTSRKLVISSITPDGTGKINLYIFTEPGQELGLISGIQIWKN